MKLSFFLFLFALALTLAQPPGEDGRRPPHRPIDPPPPSTTSSGSSTTTTSGSSTSTTSGSSTTTTHGGTTTLTPGSTASTTSTGSTTSTTSLSSVLATILGGEIISITNPILNQECYTYNFTIGQGGLLNLTRILFPFPCSVTCASLPLVNLNIPLDITGTVLNLPLVATGFIGVDVSTGLCGIVIDVDITPLVVNALDIITLDLCLDLTAIIDLGSFLNTLAPSLLGTVDLLLSSLSGPALTSLNLLVPDLCSLLSAL
jgi:hypothetical protein